MIEVLKSLFAIGPEISWRAQLSATASLASSALAPLFVVSSRILIDPIGDAFRQHSRAPTQSRPISAAIKHTPGLEPRPAGSHWLQIAQRIEDRLQGARKAAEFQSAALVQVDAADFTLAKIIEDLSAVMPHAAELRARSLRPIPVPRRALAA
jgi:hypothetical protein